MHFPADTLRSMARTAPGPGFFLVDVTIPPPPWSPWLRLAHVFTYGADSDPAPLRRLRDWELILQLRGASWIWWERTGTCEALPAGSAVLIPPGEIHAQGQMGEHLAVHFDLLAQPDLHAMAMIERIDDERIRRISGLSLRWRLGIDGRAWAQVNAVQALADPARWRARLMPLVDMWLMRRQGDPSARLQAASIIAAMMHDFVHGAGPAAILLDPAGAALTRLLADIDVADRRWTVAGLARRAGLGETAFRTTFLRLTGLGPRAWLEQQRFARAQLLLIATNQAIGDIGTACGYDDPFHFSRVCRRLTGRSPRALRAAAQVST